MKFVWQFLTAIWQIQTRHNCGIFTEFLSAFIGSHGYLCGPSYFTWPIVFSVSRIDVPHLFIHLCNVTESVVIAVWQSRESCAHTVNDWEPRPHSVSITDFGAVGDGKTLNTIAFENAMFYLRSYADKGGAQLYIPAGRWLTGSIHLISHLTLFLEKGATILGSEVTHSNLGFFAGNIC